MRSLVRKFAGVTTLILGLVSLQCSAQTMKTHFIDVGQGASTLLEFPCAAILIDAGGEKNREFDGTSALMEYLDVFFAGRPDLKNTFQSIVLTHPHKDHTLGIPTVLTKYKVLNAVTNGMETGSGRLGQIALHNKVVASEEGEAGAAKIGFAAVWQKDIPKGQGLTNDVIDPVNCADIDPKITALWGQVDTSLSWPAKDMDNGNNHSVVLRIDFGKSSMLISGDLEENAIASLLNHYKGTNLLDVDVIVVNHHGSHNGTTDALLKATTPDIAVIQMGSNSRELAWTAWAYGHPRKVAVDLLQKYVKSDRQRADVTVASGAKRFLPAQMTRAIYGTGWDGTIVLEADVSGLWKPFGSEPKTKLIDLNTATNADLVKLPMIGTARANAIIQYRNENGPFSNVDDLLKVERIKSGTVNAIRNLVKIGS